LANDAVHLLLRDEWAGMLSRHGWAVGRYVVMPDHVHFIAEPLATGARTLSVAMGAWKEWTSKGIVRLTKAAKPLWQPEFFDHLLRSNESRAEKWLYVRQNPVRAGLVTRVEDWPFAGSIHFD
jgi:REP element-mobilizing transposase RayT